MNAPDIVSTTKFAGVSLLSVVNPQSEKLFGVMKKMQEAVTTLGQEALFKFPQIVVIGDQSPGMISVLESLVGKSFLPRVFGTVARRSLLIRFRNLTEGVDGENLMDKLIFEHTGQVFTDFNQVKMAMAKEIQAKDQGQANNCQDPFAMTLYLAQAIPNIAVMAIPGNRLQYEQNDFRDFVFKYISDPNAIILCVVSDNSDISASGSLKIAREADSHAERTIVVIPKLDLTGYVCKEIHNHSKSCTYISVNYDFQCIVSNSLESINYPGSSRALTISRHELQCFQKICPKTTDTSGRNLLAQCLRKMICNVIKRQMPNLRVSIETALSVYNEKLKVFYNPKIPSKGLLLRMITDFADAYRSEVYGQHSEIGTEELLGGARIIYIFQEIFGSALRSVKVLEGFSKESILNVVRNSVGAKPCTFLPDSCVELLLKRAMFRMEVPALRCVQNVYDEMQNMLYTCTGHSAFHLNRFPMLFHKIIEASVVLLNRRIAETKRLVENMIAIQGAYINTAHPDFNCSYYFNYEKNESRLVLITEDNRDVPLVAFIEALTVNYFNVVKAEVLDTIPKAIMHCFVNYVLEHIHSELVKSVFVDGFEVHNLLKESESFLHQKESASQITESLENAVKVISEIEEGNFEL